MAKNTIEGTFGAFGKITGSVGSGIANMTQDDEYLREREKRNLKKVSNIGEVNNHIKKYYLLSHICITMPLYNLL